MRLYPRVSLQTDKLSAIRLVFILFLTLVFSNVYAQLEYYLPGSTTGEVISHSGYTLSYSEKHEQAEWVTYELTSAEAQGSITRTNDFRVDHKCRNGSAFLSDFKGSGYDRGHLAPAGDMAYSSTAMSESFLMSNICPQNPSFNRGIWLSLESQVREWAISEGAIIVVTGPVVQNERSISIGSNEVAVPKSFYKIIYDHSEPELKAIAFLLPNKKGYKKLREYVVTIDSLESLTSIDFFPRLPDKHENSLESEINIDNWSFENTSISISNEEETRQCLGITNSKSRCNRYTTNTDQYCWQHSDQRNGSNATNKETNSFQCLGITQDGDQCKRTTTNSYHYCWQHLDHKSKTNDAYNQRTNSYKRCTARTQKGTRCKRKTKNPGGKCWQHK